MRGKEGRGGREEEEKRRGGGVARAHGTEATTQ